MLEVGNAIWAGSSEGVLVFELNPLRVKRVPMPSYTTVSSRNVPIVAVGSDFVWVAMGSEIHIFSADVRKSIIIFRNQINVSLRQLKRSQLHAPIPMQSHAWLPYKKQKWSGLQMILDLLLFGTHKYVCV